jgi:2-(1,2-epoxy-1,2-dihydrophenyl)acetyl-CoA isomerase
MKKRTGEGGVPKRKKRTARTRRVVAPDADVLYGVDRGVAWITLNRPERNNALAGSMREEILALIKEAGSDPGVGCLVITGAGKSFCVGGDVSVMAAMRERGEDFEALGRLMDLGGRIVMALASLPKPSLASLPGAAAGAGCSLALACDFRIASRKAGLGQTFVRVGLHPDWGGTYFLPRLAGPAAALEMFTTGRMVPAAEALGLGLVNRVVSPSRLATETRALAERLAAAPPLSFLSAREAVRRSLTASLSAMLVFERQAQRLCWSSEDSAEGIHAFLSKRSPRFSGR